MLLIAIAWEHNQGRIPNPIFSTAIIMVTKRTLLVGGIEVNVFSLQGAGERRETVVFFFLHGRRGSAEEENDVAIRFVEKVGRLKGTRGREFVLVTFDHRNHGKRLVDPHANDGWSKNSEKTNNQHAVDMFTIQAGTAQDVSFLIDYLPSFLYPDDEPSPIVEWGVSGKSLGGHSSWIALSQDPRIKTGIPMIGCPDYVRLMTGRAGKYDIDTSKAPYFPESFKVLLKRVDVASICAAGAQPFRGKQVLVLSGGADHLVPWKASQEFVENTLDVGSDGVKKIIVYDDVGHECTNTMIDEAAAFVIEHCM